MVKRKEVKIDEEQIRSMMTGDIPDAVLKTSGMTTILALKKKTARNR